MVAAGIEGALVDSYSKEMDASTKQWVVATSIASFRFRLPVLRRRNVTRRSELGGGGGGGSVPHLSALLPPQTFDTGRGPALLSPTPRYGGRAGLGVSPGGAGTHRTRNAGGITPHRFPQPRPGETTIDVRSFTNLATRFSPVGFTRCAWPLQSVQFLSYCFQLGVAVVDEASAQQALGMVDVQCFNSASQWTTVDVVAEDIRTDNAKFAPLGALRVVFIYHTWALAQLVPTLTFQPWPVHRGGFVDVCSFYHLARIGGPPGGTVSEPALARRVAATTFLGFKMA